MAVYHGPPLRLLCRADASQSPEAASPRPEGTAEVASSAPAQSPSSSDGAVLMHAPLVPDSTRAADGPHSCKAGLKEMHLLL